MNPVLFLLKHSSYNKTYKNLFVVRLVLVRGPRAAGALLGARDRRPVAAAPRRRGRPLRRRLQDSLSQGLPLRRRRTR